MTEIKAAKWKKIIFFLMICSILIGVLLFIRTILFSGTKGISGKDTALLNPKYQDAVSEILLRSGTSEILLYKKEKFWWGSVLIDNENVIFPLNSNKISDFIKTLSAIRKVYHISDNVSLYKDYNLDNNAFYIEARDSSKAILLELFTGRLNYNGAKISFRTGKSTSIYETESDLVPYIHTQAEKWADMQLLPAEHAAFDETEVLGCSIDGIPAFQDNRTELEAFLHKLITARGSVIQPGFANNTTDFSRMVLIEMPQKIIRLFFIKNESEETYSIQTEINGKLSAYSLEISSWTFNNIFASINQ
ncbi:MAG: DUF4340 domain-containing protein [Spirochaetaceae bacterium]|nr:DUF4340 domain-containing protein [Spirochaetaceae bacterium]